MILLIWYVFSKLIFLIALILIAFKPLSIYLFGFEALITICISIGIMWEYAYPLYIGVIMTESI